MIKKLQRRFVLICMCSVAAIIVIILGAMNISNYASTTNGIYGMLSLINENGGKIPMGNQQKDDIKKSPEEESYSHPGSGMSSPESGNPKFNGINFNAETRYKTRYFYVKYDNKGNIIETNTENIAAISADTADEYASKVIDSRKEKGKLDNYYYKLFTSDDGNKMLIFLDCTEETSNVVGLLVKSAVIALAGLITLFVIVTCVSPNAIKPFSENIEKQKQFITDASHEIKTPIAIISANADVLSLTDENNEWIKNIKHQTTRLGTLVNNLVMLSKLDEENRKLTQAEFSFSDTVKDSVQQFETLAEIDGKTITSEIQDNVVIKGNEDIIRQLVFILIDNALKYSVANDDIKITLSQSGKESEFTVYNKCNNLKKEDMKQLFDRFYRADESRSRDTGGYGIGLSLAKAIAEVSGGSITASTDEKSVQFKVKI